MLHLLFLVVQCYVKEKFWTEVYRSKFSISHLMYLLGMAYAMSSSCSKYISVIVVLFFITPGIKKQRDYCWYKLDKRATGDRAILFIP